MLRVLVVDDDFMVAKVHSAFVDRTPGYTTVGQAHTGADAIRQVHALRPDLVLLDIYLPDMTGLEVLQQLRATGDADVDVLVVSAAKDVDAVKLAMRGGAVSYLIKPFHYSELEQRLKQHLEVRRRLDDLAGETGAETRQQDVDHIFRAPPAAGAASPAGLPKGVSQDTMALVRKVLSDAGDQGLSASECAELTGLSRVSARRYLEYLTTTGEAEVWSRYGGAGRPERRFKRTS
jgi:response regulator of citrate/malate metabolism